MKFVDLKCPNCGGKLNKNNDSLTCESCGAMFAIDYDESDVEYEKVKLQKIENERKQQVINQNEKSRYKFVIFAIIFVLLIIGCPIMFFLLQKAAVQSFNNEVVTNVEENKEPEINYDVTIEDIKPLFNDFVETGKTVQMNIDQCAVWNQSNAVKFFSKTNAELESAYLVKNIPNVKPKQSNRLVIIYKVTWYNENYGEQTCYDAVYFEGLQVNPNGGVITDFNGSTIDRSEAAWGWSMAYSFEEFDQCYRESVTALGGTVEEIEIQ